jgi:hypothetical protein
MDLRRADLRQVFFGRMDLKGAILSRTNLYDADLKGCDLSEAMLYKADLRGTELEDAVLQGADLDEAVYDPTRPHWPVGYSPPSSIKKSSVQEAYDEWPLPG